MAGLKCAIREVAKDVWTFSCPHSIAGLIALGGRSTAVRLSNGDVWVLASTPLTVETKRKLDELGPVRYIVGANLVHTLYVGEFKRHYPRAKVIGHEEVAYKYGGVKLDGAWGKGPANTKYGFENDIQYCHFTGIKNRDVVFFHPASKSLIEADLLLNFPATEQYPNTGPSLIPRFNILNPSTWLHKQMLSNFTRDTEEVSRDVRTVAGWDFERIIPCHGDVIEKNGKTAWREAYKSYFS